MKKHFNLWNFIDNLFQRFLFFGVLFIMFYTFILEIIGE